MAETQNTGTVDNVWFSGDTCKHWTGDRLGCPSLGQPVIQGQPVQWSACDHGGGCHASTISE